MKKKLFAIFGPILLAFGLIAVFFTSSYRVDLTDPTVIKKASTSMSENVLKGDIIKNEALAEKKYVPFFGSSELSRISPFHPSVLAEKYHRDYRPFLLGAPGTQSLSQYMMMRSAGDDLKNKKIVFIISPQWFVKDGVKKDYFDTYYSQLQTLDWLFSLKKITPADRYLARRLLHFSIVKKDEKLTEMLQMIKKGQLPSVEKRNQLRLNWNILKREDEMFSNIGLKSKQDKIDQAMKPLPANYQEKVLANLAENIGRKSTSDNSFELKNDFYKERIRHHLKELKNSQKNWDYRFSPEFSDFQLVLQQLAQEQAEALFIIPPVNQKWSDYTGLSQEMLQGFAKKIKFQLQSQGFDRIADFTKMADQPYFMEDTIHLGWKGWLAADQRIRPFLENQQQPSHYQLDPSFYSKDWQKHSPNDLKENQQ
ncbi:D-alanyl-lipoteichoic acid biosynthesis protein DltD [Enterococcus hirae]|uniref:D-alanyl-lipoteichoic acid biosynthesis protein DltD n=1 Tax=Enterococcus TaxID=1350 RepID=UPI0006B1ED28|nr:D-alanyl-lipoteichoic acid biosynthesis protein DltD [Enterococcus hirae]HCU81876.1 D-alanyl-lipoteichoic acid biosynthesis protein DltD [Enterococcus sp.]EMF0052390.1 D-alanyl-lipoteichoic acid biosynthesis protein DltD [Enterococcus hirae]EMF0083096.1 D-alanyl-lipoteichoic acid biosynthesis protein DltD [Enterococcus hirae]EMF0092439.1 D-alanyl-lipoteichoic acid biosynthesis protein DltD [Enterococcus hirae]EMF0097571.1 D-alanyl-lipoteichoic acid biosynthesis protein DltD [Enterococcus hi